MIIKYKGHYFNADTSYPFDKEGTANIWGYMKVDGFTKGVTKRGYVYYEKTINIKDAEQVFDCGFSAMWNGEWLGVEYSSGYTDSIELWSTTTYFAKENGFKEDERGSCFKIVPFDECSAFRIYVNNKLENKESFIPLEPEEFKLYYKILEEDLIPGRVDSEAEYPSITLKKIR